MCALSAVTVSVRLKKRAESSRGKIDGAPRCVVYLRDWLLRGKVLLPSCTIGYNNDEGGKKKKSAPRARRGKSVFCRESRGTIATDRDPRCLKKVTESTTTERSKGSKRLLRRFALYLALYTRKIVTVGRHCRQRELLVSHSVGRYGSPRLSRRSVGYRGVSSLT